MATQKRKGAKAPRRELVRANLRLDAEVYRRLLVHSVMENKAAGDIVSELLAEHLKGWSMPGRLSARVMVSESAEIDGEGENSLQDAA